MHFLKSRRLWLAAIAIAAVTIVLGAVGVRSYRQRVAIENIKRLGAGLGYDLNVPRWIKGLWWRANIDGGIVVSVDFAFGPAPTRRQLPVIWENLRELPSVQALSLNWIPLRDDDLAELACLPRLNTLSLSSTGIGDDGLAHLSSHKRLARLNLADTQVTDAGLAHLKRLPQLESLILDGTLVTDEGMRHLAELPNLREVSLSNTAVTEAGVALLAERIPGLSLSDD